VTRVDTRGVQKVRIPSNPPHRAHNTTMALHFYDTTQCWIIFTDPHLNGVFLSAQYSVHTGI